MSDAELLVGFGPDEYALLLNVLRREDEARSRVGEQRDYRKPTDKELIAAGWKSPPPPPSTETSLLWGLYLTRKEGPRVWALFSPADDAVLHRLHQRAPWLLRHKVTKRWGDMWRLANF